MDGDEDQRLLIKVGVGSLIFAGILILGILLWNSWTKKREGTIVLPGGITYLGPSPTPASFKPIRGNLYPYHFSVPDNLSLTTFPEDPYDIYALSENPSSNVLIGVEDLSKDSKRKPYSGRIRKYIEEFWWKQFNLTGVEKIEQFTNQQDLKGYKVKFKNSPYDDVFFEVPDNSSLVIHMSNMTLPDEVFEKIIQSVGWKNW